MDRKLLEQQLNALTEKELLQKLRAMKVDVDGLKARVQARESILPSNPFAGFKSKLPDDLRAGNIGDITKVYWNFFFSSEGANVPTDSVVTDNIKITQEALFAMKEIRFTVFEKVDIGVEEYVYKYVDMYQRDEIANGLYVELIDAQSNRTLNDQPMPISALGCPDRPFVLPKPYMFLPNSIMDIKFTNTSDKNYFVFAMLNGYRIRFENQSELLSLARG